MPKKPPKKGSHHETIKQHADRLAAMLDGIPKTDAVAKPLTPQARIRQLEKTIAIYERERGNEDADLEGIERRIVMMRRSMLETAEELLPKAKAMARRGKPALLRLISRIVRSAR